MKRSYAYSMIVVISGLIMLGAGLAAPQWCRAVGLDFWNVPSVEQELEEQSEISEELSEQSAELSRRRDVKYRLMDDLYFGYVDLAEAAGWFRAMNLDECPSLHVLRRAYPGSSDNELFCRNVIEYARAHLADRAGGPDVLARLMRQFEVLRAQPGGIILPVVHYDDRPAE